MKLIFQTKEKAYKYYNKYKSEGLRGLNEEGISDWDPETKLRYVLHKYNFKYCTIKPLCNNVHNLNGFYNDPDD